MQALFTAPKAGVSQERRVVFAYGMHKHRHDYGLIENDERTFLSRTLTGFMANKFLVSGEIQRLTRAQRKR